MMKLSSTVKALIFALLLCVIHSYEAKAQVTITENQPLSFGTFAMSSFSNFVQVRLRNNGTFTTNRAVILVNPTRGEYTLDAGVANANVVYTVTVPASVPLTGPSGNSFNMDDIRVRPNTLRFNGAGLDDIRVAARLRSVGDGVAFNGGTYTATLALDIVF